MMWTPMLPDLKYKMTPFAAAYFEKDQVWNGLLFVVY
jgi:hypothetical protein